MIQELFHIGRFSVSPFGLMLVCAFLASYLQLRWGLRWLDIGDDEDASSGPAQRARPCHRVVELGHLHVLMAGDQSRMKP